VLIEDLAQAQGAKFPDGRPAGSVGDAAVFSFNRTKVLDCGGGALVLRSTRLANAWRPIAETWRHDFELDPATAGLLSLSERNLYHALVALRRTRSDIEISAPFLSVQEAYSGLHLRSMQNAAEVAHAWKSLPRLLGMRAEKASVYSSKLAGGPWRLLDGWLSSGVCWRYSLLTDFPETLLSFTEAVRSDGFYVSNLYWPLNELMYPGDACPNAASFARRVINLWVDDAVTLDWVEKCCDRLRARADQYAKVL
jgi:dTDP-4-amino-4,6-dideoxygalactose transaminase